ncbi:MAG TPA: TlpA disulfide reductase family protein [Candidatus Sulfotelmatobacter sp.]|jgi:thiol-disulfide isomerase/thioredoxin|nr:TlpA disulfide reductase family protein [Candidatus Sulfotelmatobacter sp.]
MRVLLPILVLALFACPAAADAPRSAKAAPVPTPATGDAVKAQIRSSGAAATLVNVWATWCVPCREEFPDLLKAARDLSPQGVRLVLVSVDFPGAESEVRDFLTEQGVDFPSFVRTGKDEAFIDAMSSKWSGAIPATFVFDQKGALARSWEGKASFAEIKDRVLETLTRKEAR